MAALPPSADCIFITGPTASGKTAVGVALAKMLGAEVISMDSMAALPPLKLDGLKLKGFVFSPRTVDISNVTIQSYQVERPRDTKAFLNSKVAIPVLDCLETSDKGTFTALIAYSFSLSH